MFIYCSMMVKILWIFSFWGCIGVVMKFFSDTCCLINRYTLPIGNGLLPELTMC